MPIENNGSKSSGFDPPVEVAHAALCGPDCTRATGCLRTIWPREHDGNI
jgi:hypothetical protein